MSVDGQELFVEAQVQSALEQAATIFATYYKALIENGIPVELAASLTSDYAEVFWNDVINRQHKDA